MSSARDYALCRLDSRTYPNWPPRKLPGKFASQIKLPSDPRDRALAEQIETGVTKNLLQLQYWIGRYAGRPLPKIHPLLQKILGVAIYQLRFLDRVPESAAVNEAVDQAKRFGMKHAAGFVNAVLRKAATGKREPVEVPDAVQQAELLLSHPLDLFSRLVSISGEQTALDICRHNNQEPPIIVRFRKGKSMADLLAAGAKATAHGTPGLAVLHDPDRALLARLAQEGIAQVQDPTSAKVVEACAIQPGETFLDRCCGMGTKTLQAWELLGAEAAIVAIDPAKARCDALLDMLAARRITNVRVIQAGEFPAGIPEIPASYRCVLVDAPCSNSGVLARRPEARYTQGKRNLESVLKLQQFILMDAAARVEVGGRLVYSTCSIWPEENGQLVQWFLSKKPEFLLEGEETTLPSPAGDPPEQYHDGGYYAVLIRKV